MASQAVMVLHDACECIMHRTNQPKSADMMACLLQLASGMQNDMLQMIQAQPSLLLHDSAAQDDSQVTTSHAECHHLICSHPRLAVWHFKLVCFSSWHYDEERGTDEHRW